MISWIIIICAAILIVCLANNGVSVETLYSIGFIALVLATIFDRIW